MRRVITVAIVHDHGARGESAFEKCTAARRRCYPLTDAHGIGGSSLRRGIRHPALTCQLAIIVRREGRPEVVCFCKGNQ